MSRRAIQCVCCKRNSALSWIRKANGPRTPSSSVGATDMIGNRRSGMAWLLAGILTGLAIIGAHAAVDDGHSVRVLYLNAYDRGYPWSNDVERGLRERLAASSQPLELSVEYLDSRRFPDRAHLQTLADLLAIKYAHYPLDLVVVSDNAAFDFAIQNRERLFPGLPLVFCGYNNFRPEVLSGIANVTGVNEEIDLAANIELALQVHPATHTLAFITSTGDPSSQRNTEIAEATIFPRYRDRFAIVALKDASMAEIRQRLAELPRNSAVFLLGQTRDQGEGRALTPVENGRLIAAASPVPVYAFWDFHLGTGVLGGHILTGVDQGQAAADLALRILSGTPVADLPVIMTSPACDLFDFTVMQRFGVRAAALPPGSRIINRPSSFWNLYRWRIIGALILLIAETLLIIALLRTMRQRHGALEALREERTLLEDKVRERTAALNQIKELAEQTTRSLAESEARFRSYFELPLIGSAITSPEKGWLEVNAGLCALLGYTDQELTGLTWAELTHPDDLAADVTQFNRVLAGEIDAYALEKRFIRKNGEVFWALLSVGCVRKPDGSIDYFVALVQDIMARKQAAAALEVLATIDSLTQLANRRRFDRRLEDEWKRARRAGAALAVLFADIDHFKAYNDHYGHGAGDQCLIRVADALTAAISRPGDTAARYGGEEFVAVLSDTDALGAAVVAERFRAAVEALALPHAPVVQTPWVTVSVGYASLVPGPQDTPSDLLSSADRALYQAKRDGRNCVRRAT